MLDLGGQLIAFEMGELDEDESVELFQNLVDTGVINRLQGSYQRIAVDLALSGKIDI